MAIKQEDNVIKRIKCQKQYKILGNKNMIDHIRSSVKSLKDKLKGISQNLELNRWEKK